SLAVAAAKTDEILTPEMKKAGDSVVLMNLKLDDEKVYDFKDAMAQYDKVTAGMRAGEIIAAYAIDGGGLIEAVVKMCLGNGLGFAFNDEAPLSAAPIYGSLVLELAEGVDPGKYGLQIGTVTADGIFTHKGESVAMDEVLAAYEGRLEKVYKTVVPDTTPIGETPLVKGDHQVYISNSGNKKPRVFIPVFPGTNCEYDTARAFRMAGAEPDVFVLRNLTGKDILESIDEMDRRIRNAQILMFSGGFSAGDEPEGSGKFIATVFSNEKLKEATMDLLKNRDGLALGICNGFQALIKLGLVPYGEIKNLTDKDPTLTYNTIGRHASCMVQTRVVSTKSPWLSAVEPGDIHSIAISHGEGRFMADQETLERLAANGQIATQYVDLSGNPTMDIRYNPNGSLWAIEGITSPDGRVLGKMGHTERRGDQVAKNIPGNKDQKLFASGVAYFG
ncbi:MAG: phosphoribosylformylglycinamidine synthase subunit PurQ, partial [Firmicutes bacterium]|nr:phosphoribosylformylglycinamidine synthase subunit PurQ [Bacillota bacterium]